MFFMPVQYATFASHKCFFDNGPVNTISCTCAFGKKQNTCINIFLADHQAKQQRLIAEVYVQPDAKVTTFSIALPGNETRAKSET